MGAGNGLLVKLARDSDWEAEGTELSHQLRTLARTRYGVHLRDPSEEDILSGSYDWVTLINVLDQSPDPMKLLREARKALHPKGRILIRTPNASFHFQWIRATSFIGLHRLSRLAVLHDYGFTRKSLSSILPKNGFEPVVIRNAALTGSFVLRERRGAKLMIAILKGLVASLERISCRRILWGPSIELEAKLLDN
jgi:SAM-dependent methyltransferase